MTIDELTCRQGVVCASGVLYWASVGVNVLRVRRRIGRTPNLKPKGPKERLLWLGWLVVISVWIGQPLVMSRWATAGVLAPIDALYGTWGLVAGAVLIAAGHAGTYWCYAALGDAWRLGIKRKERTALATAGPYAAVRHPLYAFQMMLLLGAGCLLPTPASAGILILHVVCCTVKALDEEAYLTAVHGRAYVDLQNRTGRFLPKLVRARRGAAAAEEKPGDP